MPGRGKGSKRSLSVINETLYYLSCEGVMAWDGSLPVNVSTMLDRTSLMNARYAAGAALDARYYLYTRVPQATGTRARLLVYDTERKLWHEEDTGDGQKTAGWEMCSTRQQLYLWDGEALWAAEPDRESDRRPTRPRQRWRKSGLYGHDRRHWADGPGRQVCEPGDAAGGRAGLQRSTGTG